MVQAHQARGRFIRRRFRNVNSQGRDYAALAIVDLDLTGSAPIKPTLPAADILPDAGTPGR